MNTYLFFYCFLMSLAFIPSLRVQASLICQYSLSISIVKLLL
uniref:Uncharacterized protein n=1 Tax=Arundo donax TaxID=35708 RepID=A0A0A9GFW7_ARUDO